MTFDFSRIRPAANLRNANLRNATLRHANLRNADLSGADLNNAGLSHTDLRGANLNYANLGNADLNNTNLRLASLGYANLRKANLSYANLSHVNLSSADLSGARLYFANLEEARLPEGWNWWQGGNIGPRQRMIRVWTDPENNLTIQIGCSVSNTLKEALDKAREATEWRAREIGALEANEAYEQEKTLMTLAVGWVTK